MSAIEWRIPPSTIRWIDELPPGSAVAVLMRHSVRGPLPPGEAGKATPITQTGAILGCNLGALVGSRLRSLHASPLLGCMQTADVVRAGAGVDVPIVQDRLLGDPGVYVVDGQRAQLNWETRGHEAVMRCLAAGSDILPGMADPEPAARFLIQHMLTVAGHRPGLHVFVTHDSVITATVARILGEKLGKDDWPWCLEGAFFWRQGDRFFTAYRDRCRQSESVALTSLDERSVVDFARREVAKTVGLGCNARFFLAGGAFKTLLTSRPPRDLDLWAPTDRDRELLLNALTSRGARRIEDRPFAEAFEIAGRVVELPRDTVPKTLEARLARSDIALSAMGVEHRPGDRWRAVVHPLARTSIERRQVLLLKPLVNWKWALTTLERMRRYANELQYTVPALEEAEVWAVFQAQSNRTRREMLQNYESIAEGGWGVREEALCRLR